MSKNKKIVVMYTEDESNPRATWSGTSYSLRNALENYVDVSFVDLKLGIVLKTLKRISDIIGRKRKTIIVGKCFDILLQIKASYLLKEYKGIPVLEIANEVKIRNPYYTYQDLSLAFVQNSKNKNHGLHGGGLRQQLSDKELSREVEVQRKIYDSADACFFMGNWITQYMKNKYPHLENKFITVGGGINKEFHPNNDFVVQKDNIILFVGIDFERKGGPLLIDAFSIVRKTIEDAQLLIVGPTKSEGSCIEGVKFLGRLSRKEVEKIFIQASVFCLPSKFEAYGLVFPEALGFGVPCIGLDRYEMPYFIENGKNGYLLMNEDPAELANLLIKALRNREMKQYTMRMANKERKKYSWDAVAERILNSIFEE